MTKFEQVSVNYQNDAESKEQANRSFRYSCECCCTRSLRIECDRYAIAVAHNLTIAAFENNKVAK